jgi:hypothetical protein
MSFPQNFLGKICCLAIFIILTATIAAAQQSRGTLRGLITDELGAAIVGANVSLTDANGVEKKTTTNGEGVYSFAGLAPGKYKLQANAPGFAHSESKEVDVTNARQTVDLTLRVTIEEKVTVADTAVSTEATNNANQTVIGGKDLDALPDDPDELAAALQALAGPSVGPNGGQIFIDGFTGAICPRKMRFARFESTRIPSRRKTISLPRVSTSSRARAPTSFAAAPR